MKRIILFFLLAIITIFLVESQNKKSSEVSTYYFIRHAEKDLSDKNDRDPLLIQKGFQRAESWSNILSNISFDAVYSTDFNRTRSTAKPTALKNKLELKFYYHKNIDPVKFLKETKGKNVLIVGHSNSTPTFVNKILGYKKYEKISEDNYSNLYIVTVNDGEASSVLLKID